MAMVKEAFAGTARGIIFERSEEAIMEAIDEYKIRHKYDPCVVIVPLPLISEVFPGVAITRVGKIPVSVCPSMLPDQILVTDTDTFCHIKEREKDLGMFNEH